MTLPTFKREWAMPNSETFCVKPIGEFVRKYKRASILSVDPFARDNNWATLTNDINPKTKATYHLDAEVFLRGVTFSGRVDLAILDPPYSPRQVSECYAAMGIKASKQDTQNGALMKRVRAALRPLLAPGAVVLSFGWNSTGMGKDFELLEVMLVAHGGAHNDTICIAERLK